MRQTVGKRPVSQMSANPAPDSTARTRADAMPIPPPHEDSDDVSVMNSEVESVMNHRRLKEAMRAPAFSEQEFTHSVQWMHISKPLATDLPESLSCFRRIYR